MATLTGASNQSGKPRQPRRIPRRLCRAGYVFDFRSISKLSAKLENLTIPKTISTLPLLILERHFGEFDGGGNIVECTHTGEEANEFIIATQGQHLEHGYLNMPEHEKPKFIEGEHEMNIRRKLETLGMKYDEDFTSRTVLD